jgi:hypothetical protein
MEDTRTLNKRWSFLLASGTMMSIGLVVMLVETQILHSHSQQSQYCVDRVDKIALNEGDLSGYDMMLNEEFSEPPVKGYGVPADYVTLFKSGWIRGFIRHSVVTGPLRVEEDMRARALGYPIQKWPYVPLMGDDVASAAAPLEVYESMTGYTSTDAAKDWMNSLHDDKVMAGARLISIPGLPSRATALIDILGPDDGQHESGIGILARYGMSVLRIDIQGAPHRLDLPDVVKIASVAMARVLEVCGK